jgi:hypothetical protein
VGRSFKFQKRLDRCGARQESGLVHFCSRGRGPRDARRLEKARSASGSSLFDLEPIWLATPELFVAARKRYERRARFPQTVAASGNPGFSKRNETAFRSLLHGRISVQAFCSWNQRR